MFRESLVDGALNELSAHFGSQLVVHPPATARELAQIERLVGPLPREFTIFLSTCDGLRVHAQGRESELALWGSHEILACLLGPLGPGVPREFVPVRGDPTGERDWLVTGHVPAAGAVMRWDPWVPDTELVASCFGSYLAHWVRFLTDNYASDGRPLAGPQKPPHFEVSFCTTGDAPLVLLQGNARVADWLNEVNRAVACGDDYE